MAKGYDNRQTSRQSFAFAPRAGRQTRNDAAATPTLGRQGVSGGENTGGGQVIMSQQPMDGVGAGAKIPEFLDAVLEPVIKAQQDRRVREGYAAAANGEALEDITARQPGLNAIFGPSDYARGAQFFATQTAVSDWKTDQLSNMQALIQMPEDQLGAYLNGEAEKHLTGDMYADNAINQALIEESATLIPRIAQGRVEYQQRELRRGAVDNAVAGGRAYAAMAQSYTTQPDIAEGQADPLAGQRIDQATLDLQADAFRAKFLPIDGMSIEAYTGFVEDSARAFLADGNLWAFNLMSEGGNESLLFSTLDADTYASLQTAYTTAGKSAQARALMQVGPEYDLFRTQVRLGQVPPGEIRGRLDDFNVRIAALSGYMEPYFGGDDMISQTEDGVVDLVRRYEADENRLYQENRDIANRQADAAMKQQEEEQALSDIMALATMGDLQAATFAHGSDKVNMSMTAAIRSDPATTIPLLISSHRNSSIVVSGVKDVLRSQVSANIAAGYDGESFQSALRNWQAFDRTESGLAARAAYYGEYDTLFARMTTLQANGTGITGTLAYAQTFGEAGALAGTQQPATAPTGETADKLNAAVTAIGPNFWQRQTGNRQTVSATDTIERLATGGAYMRMQADPNLSAEQALRMEVSALQADNRLEIVGRDAWANPARGASMSDLTQVPAARLGNVWQVLVDEGLNRIDMGGRPYTVWRSGSGASTRWIVSITPRNGDDAEAFQIDVPMIASRDRQREREDVRRRRPENQAPYRGSGSVDRR